MINPKNGKYLTSEDFPTYEGRNITFCVTADCNLRCTYCYLHEKSSSHDMTFDTAKEIIDKMYDNPYDFFFDSLVSSLSDETRVLAKRIVWDFIGGEPFLQIELIDQITEYIRKKNLFSKTVFPFMLSFSTNGINYSSEHIRQYVKKNISNLSIGITIDGTKDMHDSCRVFPNGQGSYDIVRNSISILMKDYENTTHRMQTKVTIAPENIENLSNAIIHLWNIGIVCVNANVVFEPVWKKGHEEIFERELLKLKDYLLQDNRYLRFYTSLFDENIGGPLSEDDLTPSCGGNGSMLFWMSDGTFYNCIRYAPHSMKDKKGFPLGSIQKGWNMENYKYLSSMDRRNVSDDECFYCSEARGCSYCPGQSLDTYGDPYKREKCICVLHKTRVKVSQSFFAALKQTPISNKAIYINSDDDMVAYHDNLNVVQQIEYLLAKNEGLTQEELSYLKNMYLQKSMTNNELIRKIQEKYLKYSKEYNFIPQFSGFFRK